jgi:hypothetical protein
MSPRNLTWPFMEPIQLAAAGFAETGPTSAIGFPKRVMTSGFFVFCTSSSRERHLALNSEMATSFMNLLDRRLN